MPRHHPKPRFDRRSPVQPGPSPAPFLLLAILGAIALWGVRQCSLEDPRPAERVGEDAPAVTGSYSTENPAPAEGDVRAVFRDSDYPAAAQRSGAEGTVQARLEIDVSGRVERCTVVRSSGHPVLDSATCTILSSRARFAPTRDGATYVTPPVSWRLAD